MLPFEPDELHRQRRLVERMSAGEPEALREFYRLHVGRIHGVVSRILLDPEEVREAVQDTFVKAWRQAASFKAERGEAIAWLILIARNTAIDRLRQTARRQDVLVAFAAEQPEPARDGTSDARDYVDRQLAALEPQHRRAVELAFFSGLSQNEIAHRMQVPVTTVKNYLHRGLLRLREAARRHD